MAGHLFPPKYIKVRLIKKLQCLGPCYNPRAISTACLLKLSICHGFPHEHIGTGVVLYPDLSHSASKGWLLHLLVTLGLSWLTGCFS